MNASTIARVIMRPPRSVYEIEKLPDYLNGPDGIKIKRIPVKYQNRRKQTIHGSYFPPSSPAPGNPCVIYLHGNSSNQIEGSFLPILLYNTGISVMTIDNNGSGMSDGEYISLGYYERDDVICGIEFLKSEYKIMNIVLWGRSMGASVAAWCAANPKIGICGIICDSPYQSLKAIVEDLTSSSWFMYILSKLFLSKVEKIVRQELQISMDDINIIKDISKARVPALFVHTYSDSFINIRQSKNLFNAYGGQKKYLHTPAGDHATPRDTQTFGIELEFLFDCFDLEIDSYSIGANVNDNSMAHYVNAYALAADLHTTGW